MGLFSRRPAPPAQIPGLLDSGRRLSSTLSVPESVASVEQLLGTYRQRQYPTLPLLVPAGHTWLGAPDERPDLVCSGAAQDESFLLFTFRPTPAGSEIGIYPLGYGPERLTMPVVGNLKMIDSSLSSTGTLPGGSIALTPPVVPQDLVGATLSIVGLPWTHANLATVADELLTMAILKGSQFVKSIDGPDAAMRRIEDWRRRAQFGPTLVEPIEMVLRELAAWDPSVLPYIQDVPLRIQAVLLQGVDSQDGFWADLDQE